MFALIKAAKELKAKDRAEVFGELCRIAFIPAAKTEYFDALRSYFKSIHDDAIPELKEEKPIEKEDGSYVLPWDMASKVMFEQLSIKKGLEVGRPSH